MASAVTALPGLLIEQPAQLEIQHFGGSVGDGEAMARPPSSCAARRGAADCCRPSSDAASAAARGPGVEQHHRWSIASVSLM